MNLDMTKGSPLKLILKFLVPVLLGCLFQQLYNMVDTIIVGKGVGSDALAAVGATGTIVFFILGFYEWTDDRLYCFVITALWSRRL